MHNPTNNPTRTARRFAIALITICITTATTAQTTEPDPQAVRRGTQAIAGITMPENFTATLFAAVLG